ncbi:MAG: zinc-finger domain-containing protein [Xanthomonadales bacterium]
MTHTTDATNPSLGTASTETEYEVRRADLPLSCPTAEQKLWNSHPRVYLPIEQTGTASCPYCGAKYRLVD